MEKNNVFLVFSVPGEQYKYIEGIPGQQNHVLKVYTFDVNSHLKDYFNLLKERKYSEAVRRIEARISYANWFMSQVMCSEKHTLLGPGYSVPGFMYAFSHACFLLLQYVKNPQNIRINNNVGEEVSFDQNFYKNLGALSL